MRRVGITLVAGLMLACGAVRAETLPLPDNLIALPSEQGEALLFGAEARADFAVLSAQFVNQINPTFCGPATISMVLNALDVPRPPSEETMGLGLWDQDNVFTDAVEAVKPRDEVEEDGMSLEQFGAALEAHGLTVAVYPATGSDVDAFREQAIAALNDRTSFMLVNYLRSALGQEKGGHISPVAAYNAETDRFLVLDVSRYKYPPIWVTAPDLFAAMDTGGDDWSRGFVVVSR